MQNFFISCPLGLEKICWDEIKNKWEHYWGADLPEPIFYQGGFEVITSLEKGLAINLFSKTANKVLLRIKSQKCRDTPKLYNIISKINWKKYLKREDVHWNITSFESRLFNSKKIEKACSDGLKKYFAANQLSTKIKQQKTSFHQQSIFLRFDQDLLTISLDTSGDLLHIRGGDKFRGHASIRSTLASCLLWKLIKDEKNFTLIDPMCGSGTFLKETKEFYSISQRSFPFADWISIESLNNNQRKLPFKKLVGFDIDSNVIQTNKKSLNKIDYHVINIFESKKTHYEKPIIICNPPYGKRVKLTKPRETFFQEIIYILIKNYQPHMIGIILPLDIKLEQKSKKFKIFNSGIWLNFHIIKDIH